VIEAIVRFSVRRPGIVLALSLVLVVYALSRLFDAKLDVFPEFAPAQVVIQTEAPGLPGDLVETRVTTPIESAVSGTRGHQGAAFAIHPGPVGRDRRSSTRNPTCSATVSWSPSGSPRWVRCCRPGSRPSSRR
jgi:hypothetical protein